jgi:hypothetical protein
MIHTPDQVRQSVVHVFDEWAKPAQDAAGISAFARLDWLRNTSVR